MFKMAACSDARLCAPPFGALFSLFMYVFMYVLVLVLENCCAHTTYNTDALLGIGIHSERTVSAEFLGDHGIPVDIARTPGDKWFMVPKLKRKRRRRDCKQRWGCREGLLARMRSCPDKPALPSIFLSNARSIANKMDELRLRVAANNIVKDSCVLILMETWLQASITNSAVALEFRTAHRADRTMASGKQRGGGLLISTKDSWSSNTRTVSSHCSPELEYITVTCQELCELVHRTRPSTTSPGPTLTEASKRPRRSTRARLRTAS